MHRLFLALLLFALPVCCNAQTAGDPATKLIPVHPTAPDTQTEAEKQRLAKQAEEWRQEKKKVNDKFRPLLEASALQAKASWQLIGADLWVAGLQGKFTRRMGMLYIRVDSDDRVQVLLTTLLVARDIIDANRLDSVDIRALGSWYTPDMELLGMPKTANALWSRVRENESWIVKVAPRVPSSQELTVWRAVKTLVRPDNSGLIIEGDYYQRQFDAQNRQLADALHMSVSEVARARVADFQIYQGADLCIQPPNWPVGCGPLCKPEDLTIDPVAIHKPDNFPNAVQVLDETCKGRPITMTGNLAHDCKVGMPY